MSIITRNDGQVADGGSNGVTAIQTTVSTTAVKIEFPDESDTVSIRHLDDVTLWVGNNSDITHDGTDVFPILQGDTLQIQLKKGNDNALYAIVETGSITVYALGEILA